MSENNSEPTPPVGNDKTDLSPRIKTRLAVAAALVVAALTAVPLIDRLSRPSSQADVPAQSASNTPTQREALSKIAGTEGAITPAITRPPINTDSSGIDTRTPVDADDHSPSTTTAPTRPDVSKTPGMHATRPLTLPGASGAEQPDLAPGRLAKIPGEPAKLSAPSRLQKKSTTQEPPTSVRGPELGSSKPAYKTDLTATTPLINTTKARPAGSSIGYNIQMGLFLSVDNAQKMVKELKNKGINAYTETRVQIGPFHSRAEAEHALRQLKTLGYAPLLMPAGS